LRGALSSGSRRHGVSTVGKKQHCASYAIEWPQRWGTQSDIVVSWQSCEDVLASESRWTRSLTAASSHSDARTRRCVKVNAPFPPHNFTSDEMGSWEAHCSLVLETVAASATLVLCGRQSTPTVVGNGGGKAIAAANGAWAALTRRAMHLTLT